MFEVRTLSGSIPRTKEPFNLLSYFFLIYDNKNDKKKKRHFTIFLIFSHKSHNFSKTMYPTDILNFTGDADLGRSRVVIGVQIGSVKKTWKRNMTCKNFGRRNYSRHN